MVEKIIRALIKLAIVSVIVVVIVLFSDFCAGLIKGLTGYTHKYLTSAITYLIVDIILIWGEIGD